MVAITNLVPINLGTTTSQKSEAVPRRARIEGSYTFVSLNSRLGSNKEEDLVPHGGTRPFHQKSTCLTQLTSETTKPSNPTVRHPSSFSCPLSSDHVTHMTVTAILWPRFSGKSPYTVLSCSIFSRKRRATRNSSHLVVLITNLQRQRARDNYF